MNIIEEIQKKGYLLTPDALEYLKTSVDAEEIARRAMEEAKGKLVIEKKDLEQKQKAKEVIREEAKAIVEFTSFKPIGKEVSAEVKIIGNNVTSKSTSTGKLEDFVSYFNSRYEKISEMLKKRGQHPYKKIENLRSGYEKVKVIGIFNEKRTTKNGHVLMNIEDPTGTLNVLIPKSNKRLLEFSANIINDEIIAVEGRLSKELFIADEIYQPEIPIRPVKTTEDDIAIVLTSDMHIGSKLFMKKNFENFLEWLHGKRGNEKQRKLAEKVKYLTISGDNVDGIGIYPTQEEELEESDIFKQYEMLEDYLLKVPDYIHIVLAPGNHDAVKTADPQPQLTKELVPRLYESKDVTLIGSPTMVEIHGLKQLIYHGTCFVDFVNALPTASFDKGSEIMTEMLKRRHLHPIYGGKPITPEKEDYLVIEQVPDIFQAGESHNNSYKIYRGTININAGTWQALTEYQVKQGHKATPAIVPVIETKYGRINAIHFDKQV